MDLEILGKEKRQEHLQAVISHHTLDDVRRVREAVPTGRLLVRINPIHDGSEKEIEQVIALGADILMLPMYRSAEEAHQFVSLVNGRALTNLLLETPEAVTSLTDCLAVDGVDEVHIGLNDLHLAYGLDFMFEPVVSGLVDKLATTLREHRIPFGIGGLARVGEGLLPAELLIAEHVRLGSTAAILSRTFHRQTASLQDLQREMDFSKEIKLLCNAYAQCQVMKAAALEAMHQDTCERINDIVRTIRARKQTKQ